MGGGDGDPLKLVELTQLNGHINDSCSITNDLPYEVASHSAVNTKIGPIVCGGRYTNGRSTRNCHQLSSDGSWSKFPSLSDAREYCSLTEINDLLVIIGGWGTYTSFEVINVQNGTSWIKKELLFSIWRHCSAKINETSILITGGLLDGKVSKSIYSWYYSKDIFV